MEKLTEKSTYDELLEAWKDVNEYGERAGNSKKLNRIFRKNKVNDVFMRVNTPLKHKAMYLFSRARPTKEGGIYFPFLIVEGSEGESFVAMENDGTNTKQYITVIHSHAINRFIERHGWNGTKEKCEDYILRGMWVSSRNIDQYTNEVVVYFDGGVFLGHLKDDVCHLNTYVANQRLFPNQRLQSRRLQDIIEKLFESIIK